MRDAETAEFSKLAETTYRDVNIALANEFARIADASASTRCRRSQPRIRSRTRTSTRRARGRRALHTGVSVLPGAGRVRADRECPAHQRRYGGVRRRSARARRSARSKDYHRRARAVAYRAGVKESRHSSAFGIAAALASAGATGVRARPALQRRGDPRARPRAAAGIPAASRRARRAGVARGVSRARSGALARRLRAILDGRAALDPAAIAAMGIAYVGIGR